MTIYGTTQICGDDSEITVRDTAEFVFVTIKDSHGTITMNPVHVRALAAALDAYEAAQTLEAEE